MSERGSFIFYRSFYEGIRELNFEQQGKVYNAIFGYALNGEEPNLTGAEKAAFVLIKPQIDANNTKYENGKKGGAPLGNTNAKKQSKNKRKTTKNNQETTAKQPSDNIKQPNENENVNVNVNDKRESIERKNPFETPSLSQIKAVCKEMELDESIAVNFFNYYEANGWLQGNGNPILNWVAQLNVWVSRENKFAKSQQSAEQEKRSRDYQERKYTREELDALFDNLDDVEI